MVRQLSKQEMVRVLDRIRDFDCPTVTMQLIYALVSHARTRGMFIADVLGDNTWYDPERSAAVDEFRQKMRRGDLNQVLQGLAKLRWADDISESLPKIPWLR